MCPPLVQGQMLCLPLVDWLHSECLADSLTHILSCKKASQGREDRFTHHAAQNDNYSVISVVNAFRFYIGCDLCTNWYHGDCVGITEKEAKKMYDSYFVVETNISIFDVTLRLFTVSSSHRAPTLSTRSGSWLNRVWVWEKPFPNVYGLRPAFHRQI